MRQRTLQPLVAGARLAGDWYDGRIPDNVVAGDGAVVDSSFCFKQCFATGPAAVRIGRQVTLWRTSLAAEPDAVIEIGDFCYLNNASLVCSTRITLGSHVLVAGGVTIADSDFHPLGAADRLADTVALSPMGDRRLRPLVEARPVVIGDGVWIGYNATILKGVRVGDGAVIAPGALVGHDVPAGALVAGNPARVVEDAP